MDVDVASFKVYALLCHDLSTLDSRGSTRGGWWNEGEIPGGGKGRRGSFCWLRAMMDGMMVSGTNRSAKCLLVSPLFSKCTLRQILHIGRPPSLLHFFLNFDKRSSFYGLIKKKNSFYLLLRDWRWKKEAKNTPSLFIIYYRIVSKGENCASRQGNRKNWTKEGKKKLKLSILEMPFTVATSMPHFDKRSSNILAAATRKENFNLCSRRVWSAVEKRVPKKPRSWIYILPVVDAHVSEWNHVEITASTLLHRIRARVTLQSVPGAPLEGQ